MDKSDELFGSLLLIGAADWKFCPGIQKQSPCGSLMDVLQINNKAVVTAAERVPPQAGEQIPKTQIDGYDFFRQIHGGFVVDRLRIENILDHYLA